MNEQNPFLAEHYDDLRKWARGQLHVEAATELLIHIKFAKPHYAWVRPGPWIDRTLIPGNIAVLDGRDQALLRLVAMLLDPRKNSLGTHLAGVERDDIGLVLAAMSQAAGGHAGYTAKFSEEGYVTKVWVEDVYPWPEES